MASEAALLALAESIADGHAVDWDAVESQASAEHRAVLRQLRIVAGLAELHRSLPADAPAPAAPAREPRREPVGSPAIGNWGPLALRELLGRGTFGDVYRAWDPQLERDVALKLLRAEDPDADPLTSRITAEGRLLARIRHPNVLTVYGVAKHDGRVGLWMELLQGETLEQHLRSRGRFGAKEAAIVGVELCRALAAIHGGGLVHRDVKAQNVMREQDGRIVLMDLGTGREAARPGAGDLAGTPLYLAPEILAGASASARTDLYSLGVLLYRLVTNSFPVRAATIAELTARHAEDKAVPLRDARPDLPSTFVRVIDRATSRDPERRYTSAGALEADLARALDDAAAVQRGIEAVSAPPRERAWRLTPSRIVLGVAALAIVAALAVALWPSLWRRTPPALPAHPTVAVLPFGNLSGDPAQDEFALGLTDEVIGTLARVDGLNVIASTSVMKFRRSPSPLNEIARALNADALVEGSVLVDASDPGHKRVRVNTRLIHAGTGRAIWSDSFEDALAGLLPLQSRIAKAIATGINPRLNPNAMATDARSEPRLQEAAIDLYLRGRQWWNIRSNEGLRLSISYFNEAIAREKNYARAYAGLADAYALLAVYGFAAPSDTFGPATTAAKRALELDPSLAEAHASLALIQMQQLEWASAEASFKRALELNPSYASAHHWYAAFLSRRGDLNGAVAEIDRAAVLDPLSKNVLAERGWLVLLARGPDEAISVIERVLRDDPDFARAHRILSVAYLQKRQFDRAIAEANRAAALGDRSLELRANTGFIHAAAGRRKDALRIADELTAQAQRGADGAAGGAALVYAGLGDRNRAFEWLERARQVRDPWLAYLRVDPRWNVLRSDPRFQTLLANVNASR